MLGWIILAIIVVFVLTLVLRACAFKPKKEESVGVNTVEFDRDAAVEHLQRMIRCRTVSYRDHSLEDEAEFEKFRSLIRELYPNVFAAAYEVETIPPRTLLIKLRGREQGQPSVFMAHYDVVPVTEGGWEHDAFAAEIIDGELWGRGALDTKITDLGILEGTENLLRQGWSPKNDMIIALGGDEETEGAGAARCAELFRERGIEPSFVLDEGGAVVDNVFPGVSEPCALIGIGEKGMLNAQFTIEGHGGHASTPPARSNIGRLADAVNAVERHPFPAQLSRPIAEMFDTLGRRSTFVYRLVFANIRLFFPLLSALYKKKGGELNAMLRTTVAFTQMEGSSAVNVMPPRASVTANLRLMGEDTVDSALDYLRRTVNDPAICVKAVGNAGDPSAISETDCEQWKQLRRAVAQTWPGSIVSPYLMLQCSDSRYYSPISRYVYRFSAMALSSEHRASIHGNNERIPLDAIGKAVEFYMNILSQR